MVPVLCHKRRLQALGSTVLCDVYCLNVDIKAPILSLGFFSASWNLRTRETKAGES